MKTFFKLLLLLAVTVYLAFAFVRLHRNQNQSVCSGLEVTLTDTLHTGFITKAEVEHLLHEAGLHPVGKHMDSVNALRIEQFLQENPLVKEAVCYKMPDGKIGIILGQRRPVMRIMPPNGRSYYLDEDGYPLETLDYNADVVVATGNVDTTFLREKLLNLGLYLKQDRFWNDQIMQINVLPNREIDLVPRVGGNLIIHFGTADSIARKFCNLKAFYEKVMPEVGWHTYREISLKYADQIVCKKR